MQSHLGSAIFVLAFCLVVPAVPAHAASVAVDCSKKSLATELGKLNKLAANTVSISGNCSEDIVIDGHLNLTLAGDPGASISATAFDPDPGEGESPGTTALSVIASNVTVQNLTVNGGFNGAFCENRSTCIFRDVTVQGGHNGISAQGQSAIDIIGAGSSIVNSLTTGIGVYGASSVNIRPTWADGFDGTEPGPVISGHGTGLLAQDGSFLRTDNVTISGNVVGVFAHRNATIKIFDSGSGAAVNGNTDTGVAVTRGSVGQLVIPFSNNGVAVDVGALSFVTVSGSTFSANVSNTSCSHPTAVLAGGFSC